MGAVDQRGRLLALAGGLLIEVAAGPHAGGRYAAVVVLAGVLAIAVNVLLLGVSRKLQIGASFSTDLARTILPLTPYHVLGILLATAAAQIVTAGGFPALAAVLPALVVSETLLRYVAAERARAAEVIALTNERANLLEQALTAEVAERRWIAGHVHDETLQRLAVARQELDDVTDARALQAVRDHLDAAVAELRRTLVHVHSASVASQGLGPALEVYADQILRRRGTTWTVEVEAGSVGDHEPLLYSLARDLLGNMGKHAFARHVDLQIVRDGSSIRLSVTDDGVGIAPGSTEAHGTSASSRPSTGSPRPAGRCSCAPRRAAGRRCRLHCRRRPERQRSREPVAASGRPVIGSGIARPAVGLAPP